MSKQAVSRAHAIVGRCLLVTNDSAAIEQLQVGMQQFAILLDHCPDPPTAASLINTRKFEAIVVDLALGEPVSALLGRVRFSPFNGSSVTFALIGPGDEARSRLESNFIIQKPLMESSVTSTLKAALGLIIREYRRYFRCPTSVPVVIRTDQDESIRCEMVNISEGGLAVTMPIDLVPGLVVRTEFELPSEPSRFKLTAEICWNDKKGRAGLHFQLVPEDQKQRLQGWLSRKIEEGIPEPVARLFQKHSGSHSSADV